MIRFGFGGLGGFAWQSLLDGGTGAAWNDFVSLWHSRFAAYAPLEAKSGAAAQAGIVPQAGLETTAAASSPAAAVPQSAGAAEKADPQAAFAALAESNDHFGTLYSYDFSEQMMAKLTGKDALDRGVWHGALSAGSFEADVAKALGDALTPGHGLFFTPDTGDLAGQAFLVVDGNGVAGFQAGDDMVYALMPVYLHWGDVHAVTPFDQILVAPHGG